MREYYDDYPEQDTPNTDEPDDESVEPATKVGKKDPKLGLLLTQTVVCSVALLFVFLIKFSGNRVYPVVREKYISMFESRVTAAEIMDVMSEKFKLSQGESESESATSEDVTASENKAIEESPVVSSEPINSEDFLAPNTADESLPDGSSVQTVGLSFDASPEGINEITSPVSGTLTSSFGYRTHPIYGSRLFHSGIDIGAESGTAISAALSGTVDEAEYSSSYGNYVIISHSNSVKTVYAHCSKLLCSAGDTVSKGDKIALVGETGVATGPHVHFEVRVGEMCIDPLWIMQI